MNVLISNPKTNEKAVVESSKERAVVKLLINENTLQ